MKILEYSEYRHIQPKKPVRIEASLWKPERVKPTKIGISIAQPHFYSTTLILNGPKTLVNGVPERI